MLLYAPVFKDTYQIHWEHELNNIGGGVYGSEGLCNQTLFGQIVNWLKLFSCH